MKLTAITIQLLATLIAGFAAFLAHTSVFGSVFWIFEEPETPEILRD